jgi:hypothetical protein
MAKTDKTENERDRPGGVLDILSNSAPASRGERGATANPRPWELKPSLPPDAPAVDEREALFNERATGPVQAIQVPAERITRLHGILFDLDPGLLIAGNPVFPPAEEATAFYENVRPILDRHPLARHAEVRCSGTGLHVIVWLEPAVELHDAAGQHYWSAVVKAVQRTLPVDPDMPGITALTRPVGSVNGKNYAVVETLKAGQPVNPTAVEAYMTKLAQAPFREVALPLLGGSRISPCPVCGGEGTRLDVLDFVGKCYNGCSRVSLEQLYDCVLEPLEVPAMPAVKALIGGQVGCN